MNEKQSFFANGKLLLFGEYVVMRGVPALAFPTRFGQGLTLEPNTSWTWKSFQHKTEWFSMQFNNQLRIISTTNEITAKKLMAILKDVFETQPTVLSQPLQFEAHINFDRNWGFGTSATLIALLAQWAGIDPYILNERHFGGSSYDIASASADTPILYHKPTREVREIALNEQITSHLLFVYSGVKQNSVNEVRRFSEIQIQASIIKDFIDIVEKVGSCLSIEAFEMLMVRHEDLLSQVLLRKTIKSELFSDYPFAVKSLGAWGGDFFLASVRNMDEAITYFRKKGYKVFFSYSELAL